MAYTERITVEAGITAYRTTGMIPAVAGWNRCGGAAVAAAAGWAQPDLRRDYCTERFGGPYMYGFTRGFDGRELKVAPVDAPTPRMRQGYEDGCALREAIDPWLKARQPLPALDVDTTVRAEVSEELVTA